jgi:hypothetical protein
VSFCYTVHRYIIIKEEEEEEEEEEDEEEDTDLYLQQMKAGNIINRLSRS